VEVVASLSQGRTAAAQCGFFTHESVPVIFEPPCIKLKVPFSSAIFRSYLRFCLVRWLVVCHLSFHLIFSAEVFPSLLPRDP